MLTALGVFPFFVFHECTREFVGLGGIWGFIIATPVFALVVGVATAVFFTTLPVLERKKKRLVAQRWFMVGPALFFSALMIVVTLRIAAPRTRLSDICDFVPSSARHIEVTGFRGYLAGRWLTMFQVDPDDFEQIRVRLKLKSTEPFDLKEVLRKAGMLEGTWLFAKLPALKDAQCFKREERSPGSAFAIYALYGHATSTAIVFRMFQS